MLVTLFGDPGNNLGKDLGWGNLGYNLGKNLRLLNNGNSFGKIFGVRILITILVRIWVRECWL